MTRETLPRPSAPRLSNNSPTAARRHNTANPEVFQQTARQNGGEAAMSGIIPGSVFILPNVYLLLIGSISLEFLVLAVYASSFVISWTAHSRQCSF